MKYWYDDEVALHYCRVEPSDYKDLSLATRFIVSRVADAIRVVDCINEVLKRLTVTRSPRLDDKGHAAKRAVDKAKEVLSHINADGIVRVFPWFNSEEACVLIDTEVSVQQFVRADLGIEDKYRMAGSSINLPQFFGLTGGETGYKYGLSAKREGEEILAHWIP